MTHAQYSRRLQKAKRYLDAGRYCDAAAVLAILVVDMDEHFHRRIQSLERRVAHVLLAAEQARRLPVDSPLSLEN